MSAVPLAGRIAAVMILVLAITVGLSVATTLGAWRRMLYAEAYASCEATTADLREAIGEKLQLGIPLSGLGNTQQLIERVAHANSAIANIAVIDQHGMILFATELSQVGDLAPADWSAPRPDVRSWSVHNGDELLAADMFANAAGTVIVLYDLTGIETRLDTSLLRMAQIAAMLLLVGLAVSSLAATVIARETKLWSRRFCGQVGAASGGGLAPPTEISAARMIRAAETKLRQTEEKLLQLGKADAEDA